MNEEQRKKRNDYMREYMTRYRDKYREKINQKQREWRKSHPDKVQAYNKKYWNKQGGN